MKVVYLTSVKYKVDEAIAHSTQIAEPIEYIALSKDEYIQFLEELNPTQRVLLTLPERMYRDVPIRIAY